MATSHLSLGKQAEALACEYLKDQGLRHQESNYRCKQGEIDLIMLHADTLVFVEVRYRKSSLYGCPAETVDQRKQHKLILAARHYLASRRRQRSACRFDVISLQGPLNIAQIDWIQHAFIS